MRLKTYCDFGKLVIGQQLWMIRLPKSDYTIYVRQDLSYPANDNIVLEVTYLGEIFASNRLKNITTMLIKRKLDLRLIAANAMNFLTHPINNGSSLDSLRKDIMRQIRDRHNIESLGCDKNGYFVELHDWTTDLEQMRLDCWNILEYRIVTIRIYVQTYARKC